MQLNFSWRPSYAGVLLLQLLLITDLTIVGLAKRGGGGGAGRGAKTGSVGRGSSHTGSRGSQPTYSKGSSAGGTGVGSYGGKKTGSGGSWKTHAAAGVAGAVLGAAVSHQLTRSYYKHSYGGRDYYYGERYYRPSHASYSKKCVYTLKEDDYMKYDDGYQVKEIVFECNSRNEHCCGMECCSNGGMPWWGILLAIFALICLVAACVFVGMKFRTRRPATQYSTTAAGDASVPLQGNTDDMSGAKAYTAHYAGGPTYPAYPQQPGNQWQGQPPAYPPNYGGYPPAAPAYGFNVQPAGPYPRQY